MERWVAGLLRREAWLVIALERPLAGSWGLETTGAGRGGEVGWACGGWLSRWGSGHSMVAGWQTAEVFLRQVVRCDSSVHQSRHHGAQSGNRSGSERETLAGRRTSPNRRYPRGISEMPEGSRRRIDAIPEASSRCRRDNVTESTRSGPRIASFLERPGCEPRSGNRLRLRRSRRQSPGLHRLPDASSLSVAGTKSSSRNPSPERTSGASRRGKGSVPAARSSATARSA